MQRRNQLEWLSMSSSPVSFRRMPRGTTAIVYQRIAEALATLASRESRCLPWSSAQPQLPLRYTSFPMLLLERFELFFKLRPLDLKPLRSRWEGKGGDS